MINDFQENRQIRIFISSTFRDMMQERDYLITRVFPELRRYCEERDISLFELDLRWGVTQEESENQMAFKICLNEVDNTRPFFIGLLGERYGWVPDEETQEKMKPTNVFEEYQWLRDELRNKKSITEVEIREGAFHTPDKVNAYFYIRSPKMHTPDEFREEKGSHAEKMLLDLKQRIKTDPRYDENIYENLEQLGHQVEEDFKALVDKLFPGKRHLTLPEKERMQQHVFLKSKTRSYVENPEWMRVLDEFADNENKKTIAVTGENGMGKCSLLANWIAGRERRQIQNEKIIYHFTGVSMSEGDYNKITQRLINEVKDFCSLKEGKKENEVPESLTPENIKRVKKEGFLPYFNTLITDLNEGKDEDLQEELQDLLFAIPADKKLIIVIDSLDRLVDVDNAKMLNWLPAYPSNVKMIFSAAKDDKSMEALTRISDSVLEIGSLPEQTRKNLIVKFFEKFSKKLSEAQLTKIIQNKKTENPAVLTAFLDNLRIFGNFDIFDKQIDERLSQKDNESLFDLFLQNIESLFKGENIVKDILSLISVSRRGLTETELVNISNIPKLYWSQLSNCMAGHLITINGFVAFNNSIMAKAVKKRYLKDSEAEKSYRQSISAYMEKGKEVSFNRRCEELPFQYTELKDWNKLYDFLVDYKVFNRIFTQARYELGSYWRALLKQDAKRFKMEKYLEIDIQDREILINFTGELCKFIRNVMIDNALGLTFALEYLERSIKHYGKDHNFTANANNAAGNSHSGMGSYDKALKYYNDALAIWKKVSGNDDLDITTAYNNIAYCYWKLKRYGEAIENYSYTLKIFEENFGEGASVTAAIYSNIGMCYIDTGDLKTAADYTYKALEVREKVYGKVHPITAMSYNNLGTLKFNMKEFKEAINLLETYRSIWLKFFGEEYKQMAESYSNTAMCYFAFGDTEKTIMYADKAIEIYQKIPEKNSKEAGSPNFTLGMFYYKTNQFDKAAGYLERFAGINTKYSGKEDQKTIITNYYIGNCYFEMGEFEKAAAYFEEALPGYKKIYGEIHANVAYVLSFAAMCYDQMGKNDKALLHYKEALRVNEALGEDEEEIENIKEAIERLS